MNILIVDTGPLVAMFNPRDPNHELITYWFEKEAENYHMLVPECVVTELAHLLRINVVMQTAALRWLAGTLELVQIQFSHYDTICDWMSKYTNVPMDFADACVLWLYHSNKDAKILTFDERGFGVYRLPNSKKHPAILEI